MPRSSCRSNIVVAVVVVTVVVVVVVVIAAHVIVVVANVVVVVVAVLLLLVWCRCRSPEPLDPLFGPSRFEARKEMQLDSETSTRSVVNAAGAGKRGREEERGESAVKRPRRMGLSGSRYVTLSGSRSYTHDLLHPPQLATYPSVSPCESKDVWPRRRR